ncbi:MAG: hypothetical protein SXA11_08300 [Cyanobacteriota bacterium]|nr:hypothetical protein [Cyanobacteriota bacterium]
MSRGWLATDYVTSGVVGGGNWLGDVRRDLRNRVFGKNPVSARAIASHPPYRY